jgi:hypothetical protein
MNSTHTANDNDMHINKNNSEESRIENSDIVNVNIPSHRSSSFLTSLQPTAQPPARPRPTNQLDADEFAALNKYKSMMASIKAVPDVCFFTTKRNNEITLPNGAIIRNNLLKSEPQDGKIPEFLSYQASKARASVRVGMDYQASVPLQPIRPKPSSSFLRSSIFVKPELSKHKRKFQSISGGVPYSEMQNPSDTDKNQMDMDDPSLDGELVWSARLIDTPTVNSYLSTVKNYFKDLSDDYSEDATLSFLHECQYETELAKHLLAPGPFSPADENGNEADRSNRDEDEEEFCHICGDGGNLIICEFRGCPRVYHMSCLGIDIQPKGTWRCPLHYCQTCKTGFNVKATENTPSSIIPHATCSNCPTSYCLSHIYNNLNEASESSTFSLSIYRTPGPTFLCENCIQERHSKFLKLLDLAISKDPRMFMSRYIELINVIDEKGGMMAMIATDEWMSVDKEFFSRL